MKIVHIIIALNVGGAELMLARLIEAQRLSHPRLEHHVITLMPGGEVAARLRAGGTSVESVGLTSAAGAPLALWRLVRRLRRLRPDVVQTWMYHADLLGGVAARLAGVRAVIWGVRTTDVARGGSRLTPMLRALAARLSRHVPARIVCAADAALRLHVALGYHRDRMLTIPNGFDMDLLVAPPDQLAALRDGLGLDGFAPVVGMLGRFHPVKGPGTFVAAAGLLQAARRQAGLAECRFLMVGRGCDPSNAALADMIRASGAEGSFVLAGQRADAPVCLAAMDVFALPSRTEGFPNVLAEAMAMARPAVATDVGDAAAVLGGLGRVVPPDDPAAMALALADLLALDDTARRALGTAARHRIEAEYAMPRCADRFAQLYTELAG